MQCTFRHKTSIFRQIRRSAFVISRRNHEITNQKIYFSRELHQDSLERLLLYMVVVENDESCVNTRYVKKELRRLKLKPIGPRAKISCTALHSYINWDRVSGWTTLRVTCSTAGHSHDTSTSYRLQDLLPIQQFSNRRSRTVRRTMQTSATN